MVKTIKIISKEQIAVPKIKSWKEATKPFRKAVKKSGLLARFNYILLLTGCFAPQARQ